MMGYSKCTRLSAVALGVAFGVVSAISMMVFAWSAWLGGNGSQMIQQWAAIYPGFDASLKGGFIGGAWGFVEGFVLGVITGWIYNLCLCCCSKKCCCGQAPCTSSDGKGACSSCGCEKKSS